MKCPIEITPAHLCYDRSRSTTDWDCPRKRYWQYEADGTGYVPEDEAVELFTGTTVHTALSRIALVELGKWHTSKSISPMFHPINTIAAEAADSMYAFHLPENALESQIVYAKEQAALIYGMIKGFYQHTWPQLMAKYEIVSVEEEMFFIHDQHGKGDLKAFFVMMVKPDLVLRDKETKELVYLEYKTTSSKDENWIAQWNDAVQVHSTINAIEQSLGERPTCCIVQGLFKGYVSYGKQSSPFCYAYSMSGAPPFYKPVLSYEYRNGLRRVPTWELEGGTKQWVENMPANVLADQYPQTPPIFPNDELITDFFMQRAMRELEIKMAGEMIEMGVDLKVTLNGAFPQRFDKCKPAFGSRNSSGQVKPCQNRIMCHGGCTDPLKAGFTRREPHHQLEVDQNEAKEVQAENDALDATR